MSKRKAKAREKASEENKLSTESALREIEQIASELKSVSEQRANLLQKCNGSMELKLIANHKA
uniref:AlNc14C21G2158 protein n=1 Tax=Albugo laibachii Nc14 TaxID=890382 RepID=F0W5J3_9STRA|nr:AlNc14C21G2158 [Albugo laibachii Nc14]|eukprot:CCA16384.1 AlNc14C21G2158 [Albugo laibachii Nc14]